MWDLYEMKEIDCASENAATTLENGLLFSIPASERVQKFCRYVYMRHAKLNQLSVCIHAKYFMLLRNVERTKDEKQNAKIFWHRSCCCTQSRTENAWTEMVDEFDENYTVSMREQELDRQ